MLKFKGIKKLLGGRLSMSAVSEALKKLQANKGTNTIKKHSVLLNAVSSTKLFFLSEALSSKNDAVTTDLLTAAIDEAWQELENNPEFELPDTEQFDNKLDSVMGKKKKTVKKVNTSTGNTVSV